MRNSKSFDGWPSQTLSEGHKNLISLADQEWKIRRKLVASFFDIFTIKDKYISSIIDRAALLVKDSEGIDGGPIQGIIDKYVLSMVLETTLRLRDEKNFDKVKVVHEKLYKYVVFLAHLFQHHDFGVKFSKKSIGSSYLIVTKNIPLIMLNE